MLDATHLGLVENTLLDATNLGLVEILC